MQPLCGPAAYNYVHAQMLWFCDRKQNRSVAHPKTGTFVSLAGKEDPFLSETKFNRDMPRKLVWVDENRFRGFACSDCSWRFDLVQLRPTGKSFDEMMRNLELQRDKEFTSHVCANHPRIKSAKRAM